MNSPEVSVLLVEDNDFDVMRVTRAFKKLDDGRPVIRARDGVDALNILSGEGGSASLQHPFVIILDLNMPRMGGLEFLNKLRSDTAHRSAPVFVVTTSDYHADVKAAHSHLINGYFVKPKTAGEMTEILGLLSRYWDLCQYPQ